MKKGILTSLGLAAVLTLGLASVNEYRDFKEVDAAEDVTVTKTCSSFGYANGTDLTTAATVLDEVISLSFSIGTASTYMPKYYTSGTNVRIYQGNTMTINVASGYTISSVTLTLSSGYTLAAAEVDQGQISSGNTLIPNDGTKSLTMKNNGSAQIRFSSISVTYSVASSGAPEVGDNPQKELNTLVGTYFNEGVYTKATQINVSDDCVDDIAVHFHGSVQLDRTTYFNKNELWMTGNGINSGYGTVTSENLSAVRKVNPSAQVGDMTHFKYLNDNQKYDYSVAMPNKGGMEEFYITLSDLTDYSYFAEGDWTYENGAYYHKVTDKVSDSYLLDFLAIAAPCLEDSALSNYFTVSQLVVKEDKDNESLKLQILLDAETVEGKLDVATNVLAEAILTAGCDAEFGYVNPSQIYSHTFVKDDLSSDSTSTLSSVAWTNSATNYFGWDSNPSAKGIQIGKGAEEADSTKEFTLSTTYFKENGYLINSIVVNASMGSNGNSTITIQVGDSTVLNAAALTTTATNYAASVNDLSGEVSIIFNNEAGTDSSKPYKAMYIKSITVYYTVE